MTLLRVWLAFMGDDTPFPINRCHQRVVTLAYSWQYDPDFRRVSNQQVTPASGDLVHDPDDVFKTGSPINRCHKRVVTPELSPSAEAIDDAVSNQ